MAEGTRADDERERLVEAAKVLEQNRTGIVLTGRIKDGRVELDKATQDEIERNFPDSDVSFIAVNAPFDPNGLSVR